MAATSPPTPVPTGSPRRGRIGLAVSAVLLACGLSACGGPSDVSVVTKSVQLKSAFFAQFHATALVDGAGYALYVFAPDNRESVTCSGTCALTWPPLTVPAGTRPAVAQGVEVGLVGTDIGPGGKHVVTYDGWPLYTYTDDVQPATASGQDIDLNGGAWYLIRPDGRPITSAGTSPAGEGGT